jgi:hypothetical protein
VGKWTFFADYLFEYREMTSNTPRNGLNVSEFVLTFKGIYGIMPKIKKTDSHIKLTEERIRLWQPSSN